MGKTATISFRDDDEDVWRWLEEQHKNGTYRSRSHVVVEAIQEKMEREGDGEVMT